MEKVRPVLHDILNALAIARGLSEAIESSLIGELDLTEDQRLDKLRRSIQAIDRVEEHVNEVREMIIGKTDL